MKDAKGQTEGQIIETRDIDSHVLIGKGCGKTFIANSAILDSRITKLYPSEESMVDAVTGRTATRATNGHESRDPTRIRRGDRHLESQARSRQGSARSEGSQHDLRAEESRQDVPWV